MTRMTRRFSLWTACTVLTGIAFLPAGADVVQYDADIHLPSQEFATLPVGAMLSDAADLIGLSAAKTAFPQINGAGYTVAIIDTGVDARHPALAGRVIGGYDFVNNDTNPDDDNGHGTHVAGIVASGDAAHPGLASGVNIVALKVLDSSGSGSWTNIESALRWVNTNREKYNIVAVNMSLGTSTVYKTPVTSSISDELLALKNAGIFTAVSSGNGYAANDNTGGGVAYPSADPSAVSVGSVWTGNFGQVTWSSGAIDYTTAADRIVSHTDRYAGLLDILAPGAIIDSCSNTWETGSDWRSMGGTSMAAPMVAGFSALIRQAIEENWDPADWPAEDEWQDVILQIMQDTGVMVRDGDDENDNVINLGVDFARIDVMSALGFVVPEPGVMSILVLGGVSILFRRRK